MTRQSREADAPSRTKFVLGQPLRGDVSPLSLTLDTSKVSPNLKILAWVEEQVTKKNAEEVEMPGFHVDCEQSDLWRKFFSKCFHLPPLGYVFPIF